MTDESIRRPDDVFRDAVAIFRAAETRFDAATKLVASVSDQLTRSKLGFLVVGEDLAFGDCDPAEVEHWPSVDQLRRLSAEFIAAAKAVHDAWGRMPESDRELMVIPSNVPLVGDD